VANSHHLLVGRKRVDLKDLQGCRWIVYTSSMPMRISLEQEFRIAGLSFPTSLFETRSALATMSLIQNDADTVALLSSDVASFFVSFGMARILPVQLQTESDAYEIITRKFPEIDDRTESFKLELILGANKLK
jgi:DNA-binding transcriptional LysR family regulator